MASTPESLRAIYRSLLRELPPRPILSSPRSPLHVRIRSQFTIAPSTSTSAAAPAPPSPATREHAAQSAQQLVAYLRSQRMYVSLIERYNPGMDMDQDERIRLTARRVGMDLPVKK
ncbi:ATP synthase assembly factor FMC1 [Escovopsis weberi]|uniref:ATP synthase assembly factor FMC1 n=1 Tax=Escovopsis weberi TaxID=150374 RepID=A0A0M8N8T3_ESCWE|nr:ATP synthase assembly factor FMC1 [Escovopsis weberi]